MKKILITSIVLAGLCSLVVLSSNSQTKSNGQREQTPSPMQTPAQDVKLTPDEIDLARSLHAGPPWGNPGKHPPGPERELVERKMALWTEERLKAVRELRDRRSPVPAEVQARRQVWKNATRIDKEVPGSGKTPVPYVMDEDLPPADRKRHYQDLLRYQQIEQENKAKEGPSREFLAIMGERSIDELRAVYNLLRESAIDAPPAVQASGFGTKEHKVAFLREELSQMGYQMTDDQIRKLIDVKPVHSLWTKD
jgi:hypothetical protein